jgi:hypothetical protein
LQIADRRQRAVKESSKVPKYVPSDDAIPFDEVQEQIAMPRFQKTALPAKKEGDANIDDIEIEENVVEDLKSFIHVIASWYRNNPFHNFDHGKFSKRTKMAYHVYYASFCSDLVFGFSCSLPCHNVCIKIIEAGYKPRTDKRAN